jgi:GNAT superfamily N-acetyltransferase
MPVDSCQIGGIIILNRRAQSFVDRRVFFFSIGSTQHQEEVLYKPDMEESDILSLAPTPVFTIRPASMNDIPTIVAQRRHMYEDMGYTDTARIDAMEAEFTLWLHDHLEDGHYQNWFLLDENGEIAAGAGLWLVEWPPQMMDFSPFRGYIMNVFTEPGHRNHGHARQLVHTILDWCKQNGIHTVSLHASECGRPVYASLGFSATNEMRITL